jgi:alanine-alpha-ketoisovalerate/valine-pyruvate aminotransferase
LLFNLLAGRMPDGSRKKILLPLVPEYIGYSDQGIDGWLVSCGAAADRKNRAA